MKIPRILRTSAMAVGLLSCLSAMTFAEGTKVSKNPEMSTEQRRRMSDVHEKMAVCLRSSRPVAECRSDMMEGCQVTLGNGSCPMMGGGGPMKEQDGMMKTGFHHE